MQRQLKLKKFNFSDIERNADGFQNCRKADAHEVDELKESIKRDGLLNPPIVRLYTDSRGKERVVLLAGYRRYQAIAEERTSMKRRKEDTSKFYDQIQCTVFMGSLEEALALNLSENMQRQTLNHADQCEAIAKLCERVDNQEEVALMLSISQPQVSVMTSTYRGLCREAFEALRHGNIRLNQAKKLSRVLNEDGTPDEPKQTALLEQLLTTEDKLIPEEEQRKRAKTYRSKSEVEELRMQLATVDDDVDSEHRQSVAQFIKWYFCELDTDDMLYRVEEADGVEVVKETPAPVKQTKKKKRRKKIRVGE
jgi:ParB-like chromosome segregation protein Spo0J